MTTTPVPTPEVSQVFINYEQSASARVVEPTDDPTLADAEEEEMAELWASDRGNQGA